MKRIKMSVCALLLAMTVAGLAGCANRNNVENNTTGQTEMTTQPGNDTITGEDAGTTGGNLNGAGAGTVNGGNGTAGGLVDDVVDDIGDGIRDLTGDADHIKNTVGADESR